MNITGFRIAIDNEFESFSIWIPDRPVIQFGAGLDVRLSLVFVPIIALRHNHGKMHWDVRAATLGIRSRPRVLFAGRHGHYGPKRTANSAPTCFGFPRPPGTDGCDTPEFDCQSDHLSSFI